MVYSDNLTLYARKFLIIIDRYSARLSVYDVGKKEGAQGLISALKTHFTTFGISMEIASDGGPEYTASATKKMLREHVFTTGSPDTDNFKRALLTQRPQRCPPCP